MQILDVAEVTEFVVDVVLLRLLVEPRDEDEPPLNSWQAQGVLGGGWVVRAGAVFSQQRLHTDLWQLTRWVCTQWRELTF